MSASVGLAPSRPSAASIARAAPSSAFPSARFTPIDPERSGGLQAFSLSAPGLPVQTFVIRHPAFEEVLYHPEDVGEELGRKMEACAPVFARALYHLGLVGQGICREQMAQLVLLSGGLFYRLHKGFMAERGLFVPECFLGVGREPVPGQPGEFRAVVSYANLEAMPDQATVLIGDTVATGSTLEASLLYLGEWMAARKRRLRRVLVCTLAGSIEGGQRLERTRLQLQARHPGIQVVYLAAEQLFHLMPDGTDLRFDGPRLLAPPPSLACIQTRYGPWLAPRMKCAVFDWGTRCKNPLAHLHEFEPLLADLLAQEPDAQAHAVLLDMQKRLQIQRTRYEGKL